MVISHELEFKYTLLHISMVLFGYEASVFAVDHLLWPGGRGVLCSRDGTGEGTTVAVVGNSGHMLSIQKPSTMWFCLKIGFPVSSIGQSS